MNKESLKASSTEELNGIKVIIHSVSSHRENTNTVIFKFYMKLLSLRQFDASFPLKNKLYVPTIKSQCNQTTPTSIKIPQNHDYMVKISTVLY